MSSIDVSLGEVAAALALVALAMGLSAWRRAELERDLAIAVWVLLGSVAMAALIAVSLGYRGFFTPAHQLKEFPE